MDKPSDRSERATQPAPAFKRLAWFLFIWLCSVGVLAVVAGLIRWAIKP